ncbi:MAG: hypothetical protein ACREEK_07090 [Bradyrhizobium sp.]
MKAPRARVDYNQLVDQWRAILDRSISKEAKQSECMDALRDFVDSIARSRLRDPNRSLRFYADMLVLREDLRFMGIGDELVEIAIVPAYRCVDDWLREHSVA